VQILGDGRRREAHRRTNRAASHGFLRKRRSHGLPKRILRLKQLKSVSQASERPAGLRLKKIAPLGKWDRALPSLVLERWKPPVRSAAFGWNTLVI
jgi:hypothetical protein